MDFNKYRISYYPNFDSNSHACLKWYYWYEDYNNYSDDILTIDTQTDQIKKTLRNKYIRYIRFRFNKSFRF